VQREFVGSMWEEESFFVNFGPETLERNISPTWHFDNEVGDLAREDELEMTVSYRVVIIIRILQFDGD